MSATAWEPVIGLEIHVQLKTRTKMFCGCVNGFGGGENTQVCPICLGHPGALPVPNGRAIELTILLGHALGCQIPERAISRVSSYDYLCSVGLMPVGLALAGRPRTPSGSTRRCTR